MNAGRDLKTKMASGEPVYAPIVAMGNDPFPTADTLKRAGADCIIVDREHSLVNPETVLDYVRAGKKLDIPILVRPEENRSDWRNHLDSGVSGLMLPLVDTVDQAALAVDRAYFPPLGHRGYGLGMSPFALDGLDPARTPHHDLTGYVNYNTILLPQTESLASVSNLRRILALDGIDGTVVGTFDLALDIGGIPREASRLDLTRSPAVEERLEEIARICAQMNKVAGIGGLSPEDMARWAKRGYRLFVIGTVTDGRVEGVLSTIEETKRLLGQ
ncbi:MAG: HpcH/HpaI aldolase family protein [Chloroflexota bacterium]